MWSFITIRFCPEPVHVAKFQIAVFLCYDTVVLYVIVEKLAATVFIIEVHELNCQCCENLKSHNYNML